MCNRVRRARRSQLKSLFGDILVVEAEGIEEEVTFGYDRPVMPVLVRYPDPQLVDMEWGYLPREATGNPALQEKLGILLNARAESIFEKFSFKNSIRQRRCIIMLDGFYEYQHRINGKKKSTQPFYVSLKDDLFPAAGIWDECDGRKTFAIITTQANPLMATIHNMRERQPHLIERKDWARWFGPLSDEEIRQMLEIYPDDRMQAEEYHPPKPVPPKPPTPDDSLF